MPRPPMKPRYESYIKFSDEESVKDSGSSTLNWSKINDANEALLTAISEFKNDFKDFDFIQEHLKDLSNGLEYAAKEIQFNLKKCRDNFSDALMLDVELAQDYRYSLFEARIEEDPFKEGFLDGNYDVGDNEALLIDIENYILKKFKPVRELANHLNHVMKREAF